MSRTRILLGFLIGLPLAGGIALGADAWQRVQDDTLETTTDPSRVFSAPTRIEVGAVLAPGELVALFDAMGYRAGNGEEIGTYRVGGHEVSAGLRSRHALTVAFAGSTVSAILVDERPKPAVVLEPVLLASWRGPSLVEHRTTRLDEVPEHVVRAVLAAEDDGFYHHHGVSARSIARAAWTDLVAWRVRQGGSTITQQLVKNVYLDPRRTFVRKAREAALAMALEVKDDKRRILAAYLNEIYLGHEGPVQMVGLGAASWGWFGKTPDRLTLAEGALLAGMIHCPGAYDPRTNPGPARARRDWVLARMAKLGWITEGEAANAQAEPVTVSAADPLAIDSPWFAQAAAREAHDRYGVDVERDAGFAVYSTLDWVAQRRAERVVARGLLALDRTIERGASTAAHPLEGALVSLDPADGSIVAYVGGRDRGRSTFDRARQAKRVLGSTFKPVVYAAALEAGYVEPYTLLGDTAWTLDMGDRTWTPRNSDRTYHGLVPAQQALAYSLNVPAAQLAMSTGLDQVSGTARNLGIVSPIDVTPAMALGAVSASPLELAAVFGTFAAGGVARAPHGITRVVDAAGLEVPERVTPGDRVVLSRETAYEMTSMLEGVIDHGTAAGAHAWGMAGALAGKTGTSDDRRDAWFAGYSANRVTVVWVGYDDDRPTRLSGATGALPLWCDFMREEQPANGWPAFDRPESFVTVTVDPATGLVAGPDCPSRITVELPDYRVPYMTCQHDPPWDPGEPYEDVPTEDSEADTSGVVALLQVSQDR